MISDRQRLDLAWQHLQRGRWQQAEQLYLQVLEGAGLVSHEKHGREVLYSLEARRLDEAREFIEAVSAGWDRAIERLRQQVEKPKRRRS